MNPRRDFPLLGLGMSLLLTFGYDLPGIRDLPVVTAMGAARYLVFAVFFLSTIAGIASRSLSRVSWMPKSTTVFLLAIIAIDLGSATFIFTYQFRPDPKVVPGGPQWFTTLMQGQCGVDSDQFVGERVLHTNKKSNSFLSMISRTPTVFGLFEEHPRADKDFVRPLYRKLYQETEGILFSDYWKQPQAQPAVSGLRLLGIRQYLREGRKVGADAVATGAYSPIVVSNTTSTWVGSGDREDKFADLDSVASVYRRWPLRASVRGSITWGTILRGHRPV
jgi:hypothetical protein